MGFDPHGASRLRKLPSFGLKLPMSENPPSPKQSDVAGQLCPACGMCCNGVLFADLRLQRGDDPKRLAKLGLPLERRGQVLRLPQPCPAHDGRLCGIYADRPARCRAFECRLLQKVQAGQLSRAAALRAIGKARRQAEVVRVLLRQLGEKDESLPLFGRAIKVLSQPWDLAGDQAIHRLREKLLRAERRLTHLLQTDFLGSLSETM